MKRIWRIIRLRWRSVFGRAKVEAEARREMELHLELLTREKLATGLEPVAARAAARREMGNLGALEDASRDTRRVRYLHDLADDLSFAARLLRKSPAFTLVSVLSLGLGIGANTAIFTLIKRSYLERLPMRNPEQIVSVGISNLTGHGSSFSYPLYREMAAVNNTPFQGLVCMSGGRVSLVAGDGAAAESLPVELVSLNYFELLGVRPLLGRLLNPNDAGQQVAVLSYNYWKRRFLSNPGIVGQTVRINTQPMTIIGVSPAGFDGLSPRWSDDLILPVTSQPIVWREQSILESRGNSWLNIAGRLKPGATATQGEEAVMPAIRAYYAERANQHGATAYSRQVYASNRVQVRPMATGWDRGPKSAANSMALLGITGVVLLAACMNLANLLLARASARRSEMAMRLPLGAGRFRLIRQLLTESMLLAAGGAGLGLLLAAVSGPFILRMAKGDEPQVTQSPAPDLTALLFNLAVATACGLLFGLAPALQSSRAGASRTVAGERLLGRKLLLSVQIALTLLLLAGAGLFVRTLSNMRATDLGFEPEQLIQLSLSPKNAGYQNKEVAPYFRRTVERVQALPGVRSAAFSVTRVMANHGWSSGIRVQGFTSAESDPGPNRNAVGPDYFATMGIPMVMGREFTARDDEKAPMVAIVNEAFAKFYFAGNNPLGRLIDQGGDSKEPPRFTIVGVAKDGRYRGIRDSSTRFWYVPIEQQSNLSLATLYVRTVGDPARAIVDVRRAVAGVDPNVAALNVKTVEAQIAEGQRFERMIAALSAFFGGLAAVLAAIGLYGILSYLVTQRQREIGVRLALGATPLGVAKLVVSSVAASATLGIVLALPAIYYGSHAVKSMLFGIEPLDPAALAAAAGTLAAVAAVAAWLPARRAASVSPSIALRSE